jgi:hypothetical protein
LTVLDVALHSSDRTEKVQDSLTLSPGQEAVVDTLAVPAKALLDTPQIADAIEQGANMFMEAVPALVGVLDEVAKIHPFISGEFHPFDERAKV